MKRIATAALAVCLLSATTALADPQHDHNNGGHNNGGHNNGGHNNGGQPQFNPQVHNFQGGAHNNPQVFQPNVQAAPQGYQHGQGAQQVYQYQGLPGGQHNRGNPNNFHPAFGPQGFIPGGQRPRYSPQYFPHVFNPSGQFHWRGGYWRGPPGWYYRSWYYGQILPFGWFDSPFWISNYWYYDLPVPPYGYEWIRNGPDVLLVNIRTGFVAEVVPGIFY